MKKSIKTVFAGLLAVTVLALGVAYSPISTLASAECTDAQTITNGAGCAQPDSTPTEIFGVGGIFQTITNAALYIIGALSVIMLIYGGIRYTISMGDAKNVEAAKNTIMYAIIGIVIALLAYAIVNFVLVTLISATA